MIIRLFSYSFFAVITIALIGCAESRRDPCEILSVEEVHEIDSTVTFSLWAGRGAKEKRDDEVCMFYAEEGDPRVMLFVWYDPNKDPRSLVTKGAQGQNTEVIEVDTATQQAVAAFADGALKLLAVKSEKGVVGLRVRKTVIKNSTDFDELLPLAESALNNLK